MSTIVTNSTTTGRSRLIDWITQHELILFFAFTFLFSWTIYGIVAQIPIGTDTTFSRILLIAGYGPSVSAVLLSIITNAKPTNNVSFRQLILLIPVLVLVAGLEWLDHIWWGHKIEKSLILADSILVLLAVFVIWRLLANLSQTRQSSLEISRWSTSWVWYIIVLGLWPLLVIVSNMLAKILALSVPANPPWPNVPFLPILMESFLWFLLFGGPLNEEPGWRGFALPRLQSRFSPLVSSIILGALWGSWHVPLHFMDVYYGGALGAIIRIQEIPRAILFTWLYNRTKGGLLIVLLFHAAINTTSLFLSRSFQITFLLCILLAITVIITDKMWQKLPSSNPPLKGSKNFVP